MEREGGVTPLRGCNPSEGGDAIAGLQSAHKGVIRHIARLQSAHKGGICHIAQLQSAHKGGICHIARLQSAHKGGICHIARLQSARGGQNRRISFHRYRNIIEIIVQTSKLL